MNEVLDHLERELTSAARRSNARRHRRRTMVAATVAGLAVVLGAGVGIAAVSHTPPPIDRLLGGDSDFAARPGTARIDLKLTDPGGLRWTTTTYRAKNGTVSATAAPAGLRRELPEVGGANGFVIASNLLNGPLAGLSLNAVRANGRTHYLFFGVVDAQARTVVVELGGQRRQAKLSSATLTVPVERSTRGLTAEGKRALARMPYEVTVRSYAATFPPDLLADKTFTRARVKTTLADGTRRTQESGPLCVGRRCDVDLPRAG